MNVRKDVRSVKGISLLLTLFGKIIGNSLSKMSLCFYVRFALGRRRKGQIYMCLTANINSILNAYSNGWSKRRVVLCVGRLTCTWWVRHFLSRTGRYKRESIWICLIFKREGGEYLLRIHFVLRIIVYLKMLHGYRNDYLCM